MSNFLHLVGSKGFAVASRLDTELETIRTTATRVIASLRYEKISANKAAVAPKKPKDALVSVILGGSITLNINSPFS
jgi:hypothetical protein